MISVHLPGKLLVMAPKARNIAAKKLNKDNGILRPKLQNKYSKQTLLNITLPFIISLTRLHSFNSVLIAYNV